MRSTVANGRTSLENDISPCEGRRRVVKESSVQVEEKYPELGKLIQAGKERGFIMYEELYENLPEEVTGVAEELDDIYMRLSELDIDIMDSESAEDSDKPSPRGKADAEGDDPFPDRLQLVCGVCRSLCRCTFPGQG